MSLGVEAYALQPDENNALILFSLSLFLFLARFTPFPPPMSPSFSSLRAVLLLVLLSGHMGTFDIMGWERLERKSSAYNRLDEI